jgi:hypothetical protein
LYIPLVTSQEKHREGNMDIQQIKERANELAAQGGRYGLTSEEQQELNELVRIEERFIENEKDAWGDDSELKYEEA